MSALQSDGWDGYAETLVEVLGLVASKQYENVYFLSGDEHRSYRATINITDLSPGGATITCQSIHSSAAYAPFPFANSMRDDVVEQETIKFTAGGVDYECHVTTQFPWEGDGFTLVNVEQHAGAWRVAINVI